MFDIFDLVCLAFFNSTSCPNIYLKQCTWTTSNYSCRMSGYRV